MLTYELKNVNYSNDSRVSKRDVKRFSSQYDMCWMIVFKMNVFGA